MGKGGVDLDDTGMYPILTPFLVPFPLPYPIQMCASKIAAVDAGRTIEGT